MDLIITTYGSVLFRVGYHSWLIATKDEDILLSVGGPYDGPGKYMMAYRSELGGIIAGLSVLGTLIRSGLINARSIKYACENSAAIMASKRDLTQSIYHRTEGDYDLIGTIKYLQLNWCNNIDGKYAWAKEHTYREDKDPNREERLNIEADAVYDLIRQDTRGIRGPRPTCTDWDI
jgi:hypothetical protein